MKKIIIEGLVIFLITIGGTLFYVYDMISDDLTNILTFAISTIALALIIATVLKYLNVIKNDKAEGELVDHSWDGIGEYNNKTPTVWAIAFLLSIVWSLWYILIGYPTWSWSKIGQYNEEVQAYNAQYEKKWESIANNKEQLNSMGESLFLVNCSVCHGVLADGLDGKAANLTQWSQEEHIMNVALNGSKGSHYSIEMPAGLVSKKDAKAVSAYVASTFLSSKTTKYPHLVKEGKKVFETSCSSCHNIDGKGIEGLAPNLTALVSSVLTSGRSGSIGTMPKFSNFNAISKKALNTYIYNLNQQ